MMLPKIFSGYSNELRGPDKPSRSGGLMGLALGKDVRKAVRKGKNMKSQQMARSQNSGPKPKEVLKNTERKKDSKAKPKGLEL